MVNFSEIEDGGNDLGSAAGIDAGTDNGTDTGTDAGTDARTHRLDTEILRALRRDGRASIQHIADELGVSRGVASTRLKRLLDDGSVQVFAAYDPGYLEETVIVHHLVHLSGPTEPLALWLASLPETVFVSIVTGDFSLVFESHHRDVVAMQSFLAAVRHQPGVTRVRSNTLTETIRGFFVPNPSGPKISIDEVDRALIAGLQHDGRMSYRALGEAVGIAASSARLRVQRLLEAHVIRISAVESRRNQRHRITVGLGIVSGARDATLVEHLRARPEVEYLMRSYGEYSFVATITTTSMLTMHEAVERLRNHPSVLSVDSWAHLTVVKENYHRDRALPSLSSGARVQHSQVRGEVPGRG